MNLYTQIFNMKKTTEALLLSVKYWKCTKTLYSKDDPNIVCFYKGQMYQRNENFEGLALYDETFNSHILDEWEKHFTNNKS